MKECKECGGTGIGINDKFCKCIDGRALRAVETAKEKGARPYDIERAKSNKIYDGIVLENLKKPRLIDLEVGDWIEMQDMVGAVMEIDEKDNKFLLQTSPKHKPHVAWVTYRGQKPMPLERFDDEETLKQLVDMALLFNDKVWFNELVGGVK